MPQTRRMLGSAEISPVKALVDSEGLKAQEAGKDDARLGNGGRWDRFEETADGPRSGIPERRD